MRPYQKLIQQYNNKRKGISMDPKQMTPEQQAEAQKKMQEKLDTEVTMTFRFEELLIMFNILTRIDMKYGDSLKIVPLVQKLEKIVAVDSNIPKDAGVIV